MREIKFRAWNTDYNWFESDFECFVGQDGTPYILATRTFDTPNTEIEESPNIELSQYTGLKDKNGVEIYEGDIVTGEYHNLCVDYSKVGEVKFDYTYDSDGYASERTLGWVSSNGSSLADLEECEVIGNIYENPELLEDK